jgi:predicted dithiol-disulfide oxidoreductase (DUF899 family)
MNNHTIATREAWLAARLELLEAEKALTRRSDEVARQRQALPWVRIDVYFTEAQQREGLVEYNYQRGGHAMEDSQIPEPVARFAATCGTDAPTYTRDRPGLSAFVLEDREIYHTYSTYARGLDGLWNMYQWLVRAPRGRNEKGPWWRRHDEYEA